MKTLKAVIGGVLLMAAGAVWAAVNVNAASAEELQTLDGIGEVKAQAIVDYREANGGFDSKAALEEVDGIGPATLDSIRGDVTLGQ